MGVADIYAEARAAPTIVAATPDLEAVSTTHAIVTATADLDADVAALDNPALDLNSRSVITHLQDLIKKKSTAEWTPKAKIVPIEIPESDPCPTLGAVVWGLPLRECGRLRPLLEPS